MTASDSNYTTVGSSAEADMSKRNCLQVCTLTEAQGQCDNVKVMPAHNTIHCSSVLKQGIPQATQRKTVLLSDI